MSLRRFDHLYTELSVAAGELAPRYALWLQLAELCGDPARLERFEREVEAYRQLGANRDRSRESEAPDRAEEEIGAAALPARPGPRPTRRLQRKPEWSQTG